MLERTEFEVLGGGARGGGKTAAGIVWLLLGNTEPTGTIADAGYYLHPHYRALVLRKNVSDMGDWLAKASQIYKPLGAELIQRPLEFRFPSGATIVVGHLDDELAVDKYQGQEFARILIEELTQIPDIGLYLKVMSSCRCAFDEMRCQMFLTANPGGRGGAWVRERFIQPMAPGVPYRDPVTGLSRVYIPAKVFDNPIYANDKQYIGQLMALPPAIRRAWLDGDWDAISGQAFSEFRLHPNAEEPPQACHVVPSGSVKIEPWYPRWLACDWGYAHNSAMQKYVQLPSGQVHVYEELSLNQTTPEELGVQAARFIWPEVQACTQKHFQLFLSPDAFARRIDERSIADQMGVGINKILGPSAAMVIPPEYDNPVQILQNRDLQGRAAIAIRRAQNQRVAGWMFMHAMLRWWPLLEGDIQFDPVYALKLYAENRPKWQEYCNLFQKQSETLPLLQIHGDKCPKLVRAIPLAMSQDPDKGDPNDIIKTHWDGADEVDCLRYGLMGFKQLKIQEPWEVYYAKHLEKHVPQGLASLAPGSAVWIARKAEADYKKLTATVSSPIHLTTSRAKAARFRSRAAAKRP
jgi:hypothetical protein